MKIKWSYVLFGVGVTTFIVGGYVYRKNIKQGLKDIVNYVFTAEQEHYLSQLHPDYQNTFRKFIAEVESKTGYKVLITSGGRTFQEQINLHNENPLNAPAGKSLHNYFLAIDLNLISKKDGSMIVKDSPDETWKKTGILDIAKKHGLQWGGDTFGSYKDRVHFQAPLSGTKLYAQAIKQFGSEDKVIGNQVKIT